MTGEFACASEHKFMHLSSEVHEGVFDWEVTEEIHRKSCEDQVQDTMIMQGIHPESDDCAEVTISNAQSLYLYSQWNQCSMEYWDTAGACGILRSSCVSVSSLVQSQSYQRKGFVSWCINACISAAVAAVVTVRVAMMKMMAKVQLEMPSFHFMMMVICPILLHLRLRKSSFFKKDLIKYIHYVQNECDRLRLLIHLLLLVCDKYTIDGESPQWHLPY